MVQDYMSENLFFCNVQADNSQAVDHIADSITVPILKDWQVKLKKSAILTVSS